MPSADLIIRGGTVVTSANASRISLVVKGGRLTSFGEDGLSAERVIDATGLHVLPGVIDAHVHLRDPGLTYKEDFSTGTEAAAAGGVTCVFDMPNNIPPTNDAASMDAKMNLAKSKAIVDFGLFGLLKPDGLKDIRGMASSGAIGFKCYMGETTGGNLPPKDEELVEQFAEVASLGMRVSVHAESNAIIGYLTKRLRSSGRTLPRAHYEARPSEAEEEALVRAMLYARVTACPLHIAHLSSQRGVELTEDAKRSGGNVTVETAPQYLLLDETRYADLGARMKINPSIKTRSDRAALWDAIDSNTVDMIVSDHSPHALAEKEKRDVFESPSGFPGLETLVPLMLTQVNLQRISLPKFVRISSFGPAKAWGVYPRKGTVEIGSDADFTIVDMKAKSRIDPSKFRSKAKWSPFDGAEVEGLPVYTISRGRVVMDHGEIDKTVRGEPVARESFSTA